MWATTVTTSKCLQIVGQMLAKRGRVGYLSDGSVHLFLPIKGRQCLPGEMQGGAEPWRLQFYVAQYDDCPTAAGDSKGPSVFQCFAYALKCARDSLQQEGHGNTSWLVLPERCSCLDEGSSEQLFAECGGSGQAGYGPSLFWASALQSRRDCSI